MSLPFATHAPRVDHRGLFFILVLVLLNLDLMLAILAAKGFYFFLAATPPHFTRPFGFVGATAPVEILFLNKLFGTLGADEKVLLRPPLHLHLFDTFFQPVPLGSQIRVHFFHPF